MKLPQLFKKKSDSDEAQSGPAGPPGIEYPLEEQRVVDVANTTALRSEVEEECTGGWYPVGGNSFWHGGVHFRRPKGTAIRASADGVVVAARLAKEKEAGGAIGSRNFILTKHTRMEGGEYYLLYMHLAPFEDKTKEVTWLDGSLEGALKDDQVVAPEAEIQVGQLLWWVGELTASAPSKKKEKKKKKKKKDEGPAEYGFHWEAFSLDPLFGEHPQLRGIEDDKTGHVLWATGPEKPEAFAGSESRWKNVYLTHSEDTLPHLNEGAWGFLLDAGMEDLLYEGVQSSGNCVGWATGDWAFQAPSERMDKHCEGLLQDLDIDPGESPWGTYQAKVDADEVAPFSVANRWMSEELDAEPVDKEGRAHYLLLATELRDQAVTHIGVRPRTRDPEQRLWVCRTGTLAPFVHEKAAQIRTESADPVSNHFGQVFRFYRRRDGFAPGHLELLPGWPRVVDDDEDCFMEAKKIEDLFSEEVLADGIDSADLIAFYTSDEERKDVEALRRFACYFQSEWSLDWKSQSLKDEIKAREFRAKGLRKMYQPYMWWSEAEALPDKAFVWHYHPVALVRSLQLDIDALNGPATLRLLHEDEELKGKVEAGDVVELEVVEWPLRLWGQPVTVKLRERGKRGETLATFELVVDAEGDELAISSFKRIDDAAEADAEPEPEVSKSKLKKKKVELPFTTGWMQACILLQAKGKKKKQRVVLRAGAERIVKMRYPLEVVLRSEPAEQRLKLTVTSWKALMHNAVAAAVEIRERHRYLIQDRGWSDYYGSKFGKEEGFYRRDDAEDRERKIKQRASAERMGLIPNDCTTYLHDSLEAAYGALGAPKDYLDLFKARVTTHNGARLTQALHDAGWAIVLGVAWEESKSASTLRGLSDFNYDNYKMVDDARKTGRFVAGKECDVPVSEFVWGYQVAGSPGQTRHLELAKVPFAPLALNLGLHVVMVVADEQDASKGFVYECHWGEGQYHENLFTGPGYSHAPWQVNILGTASGIDGYYCYLMAVPPNWEKIDLKPDWSRIWQPA